ncbi:MAG TPA: hypothetical protein VJH24_03850 [Candidatus Bilamarchaeaceae archaeon]|nr:hypothetical protein [Candidatus Bilamarchaeaceae archaeon]
MRLFMLLLFLSVLFFANGMETRATHEADGYTVELGYEPEPPLARARTVFTIIIHDSSNELLATPLWIRIASEDDILLSSTHFHTDTEGPLILVYAFPSPGEYELTVSFSENKTILSTFPITVASPKPHIASVTDLLFWIVVFVLLVAILGILSRFLKRT